jgi:Tol biopolymer transport system component
MASVPVGRPADTRSKTWSSATRRRNLWRFPLDGSMPRQVTTFTSDQIMNYRWSRDGKMLAISRGTESADVVLITSEETDRKVEGSH